MEKFILTKKIIFSLLYFINVNLLPISLILWQFKNELTILMFKDRYFPGFNLYKNFKILHYK